MKFTSNYKYIILGTVLLAASQAQQDDYNVETAPNCYADSPDPAQVYVPYYNISANVDCSREGIDPLSVQCGMTHYGDAQESYLNWAFGPAHSAPGAAMGSPRGGNWLAMQDIGKSLYAPDGFMVGMFELKFQGSLRDSHWHSNSAELTYIISGTARVTVSGLPHRRADFSPKAANTAEGTSDEAKGPYGRRRRRLRGENPQYGANNNSPQRDPTTVEGNGRKSETFLLQPGDAFFSPVGYHHYFEGVDVNDPLVGIALFDTDDLKTFDTPQVMKYIPNDVLRETLGDLIPDPEDHYKGGRRVLVDPNPEWSDRSVHLLNDQDDRDFFFKIPSLPTGLHSAPRQFLHGDVKTKAIDTENLPALSTARFSMAYTELAPGARLEPYWTDDADELIYVVEGSNLEIVRAGNGQSDCQDAFVVGKGMLAMNEIGVTWYWTNRGNETAKVLRYFNKNQPSLTTLYDAINDSPKDVVESMLYDASKANINVQKEGDEEP